MPLFSDLLIGVIGAGTARTIRRNPINEKSNVALAHLHCNTYIPTYLPTSFFGAPSQVLLVGSLRNLTLALAFVYSRLSTFFRAEKQAPWPGNYCHKYPMSTA